MPAPDPAAKEAEPEGPKRVRPQKQRQPKGYLTTHWRQSGAQVTFVEQLLTERIGDDLTPGRRHFFGHVLRSQVFRLRDELDAVLRGDVPAGVPVYSRLIEPLDEPPEGKRPTAGRVTAPLERAGLITVVPEDRRRGLSRTYRIPLDIVAEYLRRAPRTVAEALADRPRDLITGKVSTRVNKTLTSGKVKETASDLILDVLRHHRANDRDYFNASEVEAHLAASEVAVETARVAWAEAGGYELVSGLRERVEALKNRNGGDDRRGILLLVRAWRDERGEPYTEEFRRYRRARLAHLNDARCYQELLLQDARPTDTPGIYSYRVAYSLQRTGRLSQTSGGLQSCSRAMKSAARRGVPGLRVYDIESSQPTFLIEEFEEANAGGAEEHLGRPLDTTWLEWYTAPRDAEESVKEECARRVGVGVETWKRIGLMTLMGCHFPRNPSKSRGDLVGALRGDAAVGDGDLVPTYERLLGVLGSFVCERDRWHAWLDEVVALASPTCPGGRAVKNAVGMTYVWSPDAPPHRRRAELAAHVLQGREKALIHRLVLLAPEYGYTVLLDEHDGLVVLGEIPDEAVERAKAETGVRRAHLVEKRSSAENGPGAGKVPHRALSAQPWESAPTYR